MGLPAAGKDGHALHVHCTPRSACRCCTFYLGWACCVLLTMLSARNISLMGGPPACHPSKQSTVWARFCAEHSRPHQACLLPPHRRSRWACSTCTRQASSTATSSLPTSWLATRCGLRAAALGRWCCCSNTRRPANLLNLVPASFPNQLTLAARYTVLPCAGGA